MSVLIARTFRVLAVICLVGLASFIVPGRADASNLEEVKKLTDPDAGPGDWFGESVAISGDTAIVGANVENAAGQDTGVVFVYQRDHGGPDNWGKVTELFGSDAQGNVYFGASLAIHGDTAVVGAHVEGIGGSSFGAAYVFERDLGGPNNWGEVKKLTASDAENGDAFGWGVAVRGDMAVVGARYEGTGGAAYIFERDHGGPDNWGEVKKLTASDAENGDAFGTGVGVTGDTILVSARFENRTVGRGSGAAYVFQRDHGGVGNWGEVKKLTASDAGPHDEFGASASLSGDTAVIGTYNEENNGAVGKAFIFQRDHGGADNWGEVKKLVSSDGEANDLFGFWVAVSGDAAVVSAVREDAGGTKAGAAYVFRRDEGGADNWGEVAKLTASDAQAGDHFGLRVAFSGNTALVATLHKPAPGGGKGAAWVFQHAPHTVTPTPSITLTLTPTRTPQPVGGIPLDSHLRAAPLTTEQAGSPTWPVAIAVAAAATALAASTATLYLQRRRFN